MSIVSIDAERMHTDDFNLSNSLIKINVSGSNILRESADLIQSQPLAFFESIISRKPNSVANLLSRGMSDDSIFLKSKSYFNKESKIQKGSQVSLNNESIDMSFLVEKERSESYAPLELPELDYLKNPKDHGPENELKQSSSHFNHLLESRNNSNLPSDLSEYSPKFMSDINVSR